MSSMVISTLNIQETLKALRRMILEKNSDKLIQD